MNINSKLLGNVLSVYSTHVCPLIYILCVTCIPADAAVRAINAAIDKGNEQLLLEVLLDKPAGLSNVIAGNISWYMQRLKEEKASKAEVCQLIWRCGVFV